jgi:uncharacterized membrane protein YhdT
MSESTESQVRDADRLIYAGLLWASATCVLKIFEIPSLDLAQEVAFYAFGLSLPFLTAGLVTDYARRAGKRIPFWHDLICVGGALSSVVGFGSLVFHVSIIVGCIFVVGCVIGLLMVRRLQ